MPSHDPTVYLFTDHQHDILTSVCLLFYCVSKTTQFGVWGPGCMTPKISKKKLSGILAMPHAKFHASSEVLAEKM